MKYRIIKGFQLSFLIFFSLQACSYDNREDLAKENDCESGLVSFSQEIQPLLTQRCGACHGSTFPEAGIVLIGYDQVMKVVNSGRLVGAINHSAGFSPMPKNSSKLPTCDIKAIENWINNGANDN